MVLDALRGYFQLASGVTEEPRQRAAAVARSLLAQGGAPEAGGAGQLQQQVSALAEELVMTSRANRELLLGLVRTEVERALARLGIASADEVQALRRSVERLERLVRAQQTAAADGGEPGVVSRLESSGGPMAAAATKQTAPAATAAAAPTSAEAAKARLTGTSTTPAGSGVTTSAGTASRARAATKGRSSTSSRRASRAAGEASTSRAGGDTASPARSTGRRRPADADDHPDAQAGED